MPAKASNLMKKFKDTYGLDVTIEQVEESLGSFKYLNDFLNVTTDYQSDRAKYVNTLSVLLNKYLEAKLSPLYYRRSLDLTDTDVVGLINAFEQIREARHDYNAPGVHSEPYAGYGAKIYDEMIKRTQSFNKPLEEIWADRILKDLDDPMQLQNETDNVSKILENAKQPLTNVEKRNLTQAVITHKAMQLASKKRSTLWKIAPWHWRRMYRESKYMNKLSEQINAYRGKFPVAEIEKEYATPSIKRIHNILNEAGKVAAEAEKQALQEKIRDKELEKSTMKVKALDNLNRVNSNPAFKDELINDIVKLLPPSQSSNPIVRDMMNLAYTSSFIGPMKTNNMAFDYEDSDPQKHVIDGAKAIFKNAYNMTNSFGCKSKEEQLAIAQIITDKVMEKLSPAAVDPQAYGKFAAGYALKNAEEFNNALPQNQKINDDQVAEVFANANKLYIDLTRERVTVNEVVASSTEKNTEPPKKADPVKSLNSKEK